MRSHIDCIHRKYPTSAVPQPAGSRRWLQPVGLARQFRNIATQLEPFDPVRLRVLTTAIVMTPAIGTRDPESNME